MQWRWFDDWCGREIRTKALPLLPGLTRRRARFGQPRRVAGAHEELFDESPPTAPGKFVKSDELRASSARHLSDSSGMPSFWVHIGQSLAAEFESVAAELMKSAHAASP